MLSNSAETTKTVVIEKADLKKNIKKSKRDISKEPLMKDQEHKWFYEKYKLKPGIIFAHIMIGIVGAHGALNFPFLQNYKTILWSYLIVMYTMFGITGGIHRLWSHRAFKATKALEIILAIGYFLAAMVPFRQWIIIHRVHHKYTDTDADPHNSKRGFFYSHFGWMMIERPREVLEKYPMIDMSDVDNNPILKFCDRYYLPLTLALNFMTVAIPVYAWNESWTISLWGQALRYVLVTHFTLSVNSFAHLFGSRPYDKKIDPVENKYVSWVTGGEGWHNYHHVFPTDWRTSELGGFRYDLTGVLLSLFSKVGWAYDMKKANPEVVKMTVKNRGDGTLLNALMS